MSTIYLPNDAGDVFYDSSADECYHKAATNPVCHPADASLGAGDVTGVSGVTHALDDSGVYEGSTHRTWTACQMCVALHVSGNQGEETIYDDSGAVDVFTAPSAGVARVWTASHSGDTNYVRVNVKVNGTNVLSSIQLVTNAYYYPVRLASGDVLAVEPVGWGADGELTARVIFCPYVYP